MGWLSGWTYRKPVTLSGVATNYQMKLLLGESSGAAGEDVDCGGLCKTDFSDLRFTTSDGTTLLDYWIESVAGSTPNQLATIWIEFDSIGAGATTFYMYYGKADAAAASNGANTFILFEDFQWGNSGDSVSTSGGSITWTVARGTATIDTTGDPNHSLKIPYSSPSSYVTTPKTAGTGYAVRFNYWKTGVYAGDFVFLHGNASKRIYLQFDESENVKNYVTGSGYVDTTLNCLADSWGYLEVYNINWTSGTFDLLVDGSTKTGSLMDGNSFNNIFGFGGDSYGVNRPIYIDNLIVRNWAATAPSWGAWGSQEGAADDGTPEGGIVFGGQVVEVFTVNYQDGAASGGVVFGGAENSADEVHQVDATCVGGIVFGGEVAEQWQAEPNNLVAVKGGTYRIGGTIYTLAASMSYAGIGPIAALVNCLAAPSTPGTYRYDLLSIDAAGTITVTAGTEAGTPVMPATPSNEIKLDHVLRYYGQVSIIQADIGKTWMAPQLTGLTAVVVDDDLAWAESTTAITVYCWDQNGVAYTGSKTINVSFTSGNGAVAPMIRSGTAVSFSFTYTRGGDDPGDVSPIVRFSSPTGPLVEVFIKLRDAGGDLML